MYVSRNERKTTTTARSVGGDDGKFRFSIFKQNILIFV